MRALMTVGMRAAVTGSYNPFGCVRTAPMCRGIAAIVLASLLVGGLVCAEASAEEKHPSRTQRFPDNCKLRIEGGPRTFVCVHCADGYLKKDGRCVQADDFGSDAQPYPRPNTKPIQPMR